MLNRSALFSKRLLKFKRLNYNRLIEKGLIEALTIGIFMIAGWINLIYRLIY